MPTGRVIVKKLLAAGLFLGVVSGAHAGLVSFADGTFSPGDYSQVFYVNDASTPPVTITTGQSLGNGNPAPDWQVRFTQPRSPNLINSIQGFINTTFQYNPSLQGAIDTIDFSNDRFVEFGQTLNPLISTFSRVLLLQGGKYYLAAFADPFARGSWFTSSTTGLVDTSFNELDFVTGVTDSTSHPDFSATGGLVEFGFASRLNVQFNDIVLDALYGFDNLSFKLQTEGNVVPEPATLLLVAAAMAGLGFSRRGRRQSVAAP
jgi:hypothetical protein